MLGGVSLRVWGAGYVPLALLPLASPPALTPAQEVQDEALGQQHLGAAQHAAPAAVGGAGGGPLQRREPPPVGQPEPRGEIPPEALPLLLVGGG